MSNLTEKKICEYMFQPVKTLILENKKTKF